MKSRLLAAWHPMLFGIYPVLRAGLATLDPARLNDCLTTVILMVAVTAITLWLLRFILPNLAKRAVLVSAFYLVFFHYVLLLMFVDAILPPVTRLHNTLVHPAFALCSITLLVGSLVFILRKSRSDFATATVALDIFSTAAVGLVIVQFIAPSITGSRSRWVAAAEALINDNAHLDIQPVSALPDIYYLIVDGYARDDVLQALYSYDNTAFLQDLRHKGFVVPTQSQSNYPQTYLSLASSLNMSYLDGLADAVGPSLSDRRPLLYLIEKSSAIQLLRRAGYRFILVRSYFPGTLEHPQADARICNPPRLNPELNKIIFLTPISLWRPVQKFQHDVYRREILCALEGLGDASTVPGPKFVLAHIIAPHPPFVFGPNGEERTPPMALLLNDGNYYPGSAEQYRSGYRDQLTYLNARLIEAVDTILARSATPPVIILQADHGPGSMLDYENPDRTNMTERLAIFSAYYVPREIRGQFYDTITPVNTFRVLFNNYLGTRLRLLQDRSYYAGGQHPYAFAQVSPDMSENLTPGDRSSLQ